MSARKYDINGFFEIKDNPLSKAGVFVYSGRNIPDAPDKTAFYKVYRPAEELADEKCLKSFQLLPWVEDHTLLGEGATPAEKKGVEGVTGEQIYFDYNDLTMKGNIKVFSKNLENVINRGKIDLSLGYRCMYVKESGVYNGEPYDYVQRNFRGNHLALVDDGRMGADVAVMDSALTFTIDSKEFAKMADENKPKENEQKGDLATLQSLLEQVSPLLKQVAELQKMLSGNVETPTGDDDMNVPDDAGMDEETKPDEKKEATAMDSKEFTAAVAREVAKHVAKLAPAMDAKDVIKAVKQRDELATKLSDFVGVFDSSEMTAEEVAEYGVKKLNIPHVAKGSEIAAISAFLHGRTAPAKRMTAQGVAMDNAENGVSFVAKQLAQNEGA